MRWNGWMPLTILLGTAVAARGSGDYESQVKPLLKERCFACHGSLKQKAGLRLDTVKAMRHGGEAGDVLNGGEQALLLQRVVAADVEERMPPEGEGAALTADQVEILRRWLRGGAAGPADEKPESDPRQHWAYRPPEAPPGATLDGLLEAKLKQRGLAPVAELEAGLWLRRVTLDLTGLPPTAEAVRDFQERLHGTSESERRLERMKVVDRLLSSPAYGERWARHFMDIWRYSDWYGLGAQLRNSQKHLWHWRDWMVESLNADKGYDRMVMEMLAADELDPTDQANLRATGFLARSYYLFNRTTWLDETIEHTCRAFMGLTMQCVKCHDHKYDPVEQSEYYRMRAIFEPMHVRLDSVPGVTDFDKDGVPRVFDLHLDRATYRHVRGDEANADRSRSLEPGVPAVLAWEAFKPQRVALPFNVHRPGADERVFQDHWAAADSERQAARQRWASSQAQTGAEADGAALAKQELAAAELRLERVKRVWEAERQPGDASLGQAAALAEARHEVAVCRVKVMKAEGEAARSSAATVKDAKKRQAAEKALKDAQAALVKAEQRLAKPGRDYQPLRAVLKAQEGPDEAGNAAVQRFPEHSSGRRLALARWLTDRRHPLTARVLVNHVWLRHFGAPLAADMTDFGRRTAVPLHQDALDLLAVRFMESGWSLKALHREMVLSNLYARTSSAKEVGEAVVNADPDNTLFWRMNARRMESQVVRDSLLALAGDLDSTLGGPTVDPLKQDSSKRRALYFNQTAFEQHRFLGGFDNANVLECYRREESVMPQQALALSNSLESADCAESLAARFAGLDEAQMVEEAFVVVLARKPTAEERAVCLKALMSLRRDLFLQALLNHNDFITVR